MQFTSPGHCWASEVKHVSNILYSLWNLTLFRGVLGKDLSTVNFMSVNYRLLVISTPEIRKYYWHTNLGTWLTLGIGCLCTRRHHPVPHGTFATIHTKQESWIMELPGLATTFPVTSWLTRHQCNLGRATLLTRFTFRVVVFCVHECFPLWKKDKIGRNEHHDYGYSFLTLEDKNSSKNSTLVCVQSLLC